MYAKVKDRKTGLERTVAAKAYQLIPHRYDLLGYIDADGNAIEGPVARVTATVKKRDVAPAAVKAKLTREDLDRMNQEAMDRAKKHKEELDSLKVPEGFGLTPVTGPDQEATIDYVGLKTEQVEGWINPGAKEMAQEVENKVALELLTQTPLVVKKEPPRKKRHPSATKIKSVKTIKK